MAAIDLQLLHVRAVNSDDDAPAIVAHGFGEDAVAGRIMKGIGKESIV